MKEVDDCEHLDRVGQYAGIEGVELCVDCGAIFRDNELVFVPEPECGRNFDPFFPSKYPCPVCGGTITRDPIASDYHMDVFSDEHGSCTEAPPRISGDDRRLHPLTTSLQGEQQQ